jgi:acetyltransferase
MIESIKSHAMLKEFRGMPGADLDSIAGLLAALGDLSVHHPEIREIDINPIIIQNDSPVAVDALMILDKS